MKDSREAETNIYRLKKYENNFEKMQIIKKCEPALIKYNPTFGRYNPALEIRDKTLPVMKRGLDSLEGDIRLLFIQTYRLSTENDKSKNAKIVYDTSLILWRNTLFLKKRILPALAILSPQELLNRYPEAFSQKDTNVDSSSFYQNKSTQPLVHYLRNEMMIIAAFARFVAKESDSNIDLCSRLFETGLKIERNLQEIIDECKFISEIPEIQTIQ